MLRGRAKGLAGSMPKIDQRAVAETLVPCPPVEYQDERVVELGQLAETARRLSEELDTQRRRSAALRCSLLAAAFSGRLTSSSDEMSVVAGRMYA